MAGLGKPRGSDQLGGGCQLWAGVDLDGKGSKRAFAVTYTNAQIVIFAKLNVRPKGTLEPGFFKLGLDVLPVPQSRTPHRHLDIALPVPFLTHSLVSQTATADT